MRIKDIGIYPAVAALLCAVLVGCGDPGDTVNMAEQVAGSYYQALKNKDFEKAAGFFKDTNSKPRAQWHDQLQEYNSKLGELQSYQLVDKVVNTVYSGTLYTLRYKTKYSKFSATETLILFEGVSGFGGGNGNVMQLESLIIQSKGL